VFLFNGNYWFFDAFDVEHGVKRGKLISGSYLYMSPFFNGTELNICYV
tara:strand:- start:251 stop:394 length:144 start_codon:yes stop_codon:yes gene_type:complete